ncbi:hypothetical protein [Methylicorpusculum sp.]|uniref:hypothetical protein n=1 Tax=Methylicorpusculum sp. TaxID=2713644 RepID=UPI0027185AE5|nr:hypothetical protein [Methylicorpusculum sp.]MDO8844905.1 hypothetical protein [Methylicorpusculum sp.]
MKHSYNNMHKQLLELESLVGRNKRQRFRQSFKLPASQAPETPIGLFWPTIFCVNEGGIWICQAF